jgi:hypothetical protein
MQGDKMSNIDYAEEIVRLYFEGYSLDQARLMVRKMMKEDKREELRDGRTNKFS